MNPILIIGLGVGVLLITVLLLGQLFAHCYLKAGPNEAIVISGGKKRTFEVWDEKTEKMVKVRRAWKVIIGGAGFRIPLIQMKQQMSLELMTIEDVQVTNVPSKAAIPVTIDAVANVKIDSEPGAFARAAERFLGKTPEEIQRTCKQTLEGQLRDIIGTMTVEEIYGERQTFVDKVFAQAGIELGKLGIKIDIINIQNVKDEKDYLKNIARKQSAVVEKDAEIAEAEAKKESTQKASLALREGEVVKAEQERLVFEAQKNRDVARAEYDTKTKAAQAVIEPERQKAEAIALQAVTTERIKVKEVEQVAEQKVQGQRILAEGKKYEAEVVVPANAHRQAQILKAEGEAGAILKKAEAEAQAIRLIGQAKADAQRMMLEAEADGNTKKAEAYQKYGAAANLGMILPTYEKVVEELAASMSNVKIGNVAVVDSGGDGGNSGLVRALTAFPSGLVKLAEQAKALFGIDLTELLKNVTKSTTEGVDKEPASRKKKEAKSEEES